MEGKLPKDASVKAISLIKGVHVEGEKITLFADLISDKLGVSCSALSGANIAPEVARDRFSETTIGYKNKEEGEMWHELFGTSLLPLERILSTEELIDRDPKLQGISSRRCKLQPSIG
jgi:glycerol-3-phosphate dehydrogenase (NAD+)